MAGQPLSDAKAALILVHGRGATAQSILELGAVLPRPDYAYLAPQAGANTWYRNIDTGTFAAGETVEVVFRQTLPLNAGSFIISFGCAGFEESEYVVYDRRFDYMSFDVAGTTDGVGYFDMQPEITLVR